MEPTSPLDGLLLEELEPQVCDVSSVIKATIELDPPSG
jgi:hypothetical protein